MVQDRFSKQFFAIVNPGRPNCVGTSLSRLYVDTIVRRRRLCKGTCTKKYIERGTPFRSVIEWVNRTDVVVFKLKKSIKCVQQSICIWRMIPHGASFDKWCEYVHIYQFVIKYEDTENTYFLYQEVFGGRVVKLGNYVTLIRSWYINTISTGRIPVCVQKSKIEWSTKGKEQSVLTQGFSGGVDAEAELFYIYSFFSSRRYCVRGKG